MIVVMIVVVIVVVMMLVIMVMMLCLVSVGLFAELVQFRGKSLLLFHGLQDGLSGNLIPWRGHDGRMVVVFSQKLNAFIQLLLGESVGVAEDDGARVFHLILIELAEVGHIDPRLLRVDDGRESVQFDPVILQILYSDDHVTQLAYAGRLDQDPVRIIGVDDFVERAPKIPHQRTADASGIHLVDLYSGVLQESAVDADLTEFVLDQHDLLIFICFGNQFSDQRCFACSQKSRKNIYFCHVFQSFLYFPIHSKYIMFHR